MVGYGIVDDEAVQFAAKQEIIRRYYKALCDYKLGMADDKTVQKLLLIMKQLDLETDARAVVAPALQRAKESGSSAIAIELPDGRIVTGRNNQLMGAAAAAVLNAVKAMAGIPDGINLISPMVLAPILSMKKDVLADKDSVLGLKEALTALCICGTMSPTAQTATACLQKLKGCEAHSTCMLVHSDESALRRMGINLTCEPEFSSDKLFQAN